MYYSSLIIVCPYLTYTCMHKQINLVLILIGTTTKLNFFPSVINYGSPALSYSEAIQIMHVLEYYCNRVTDYW